MNFNQILLIKTFYYSVQFILICSLFLFLNRYESFEQKNQDQFNKFYCYFCIEAVVYFFLYLELFFYLIKEKSQKLLTKSLVIDLFTVSLYGILLFKSENNYMYTQKIIEDKKILFLKQMILLVRIARVGNSLKILKAMYKTCNDIKINKQENENQIDEEEDQHLLNN